MKRICVIDKSEDDRKSFTINTLEKLEESLEGVLYKPEQQVFFSVESCQNFFVLFRINQLFRLKRFVLI
jgi:hypothetical protein